MKMIPKQSLVVKVLLLLTMMALAACGNSDKKNEESDSNKVTVGIVNLTNALAPVIDGFKAGMSEKGYMEGENITYVYDGPVGDIANLDAATQKLVDANVDLVFSLSTPATLSAKRVAADAGIPVVFGTVTDPVGAGIVNSLSQHEGNITGIKTGGSEPKQLEWLKTIVPDIHQVFIPYNPNDASSTEALGKLRDTAEMFNVEIVSAETPVGDTVLAALQNMPEDIDAILLLPDSIVVAQLANIVTFALEQKIPLTGINPDHAEAGTLLAFGPGHFEVGQQASRLVQEVLEGESATDLPIATAQFFLSINLQTARTIGVEVPDTALRSAHTIIR